MDKEDQVKAAETAIRQGYAHRLPMLIVKNVVDAFGEKAWEPIEKAAREFAAYRAPLMQFLIEDPENARELGNVFDFEDNLAGIQGEWEVHGPKDAVKRESSCPHSELFKTSPDHCGRLLYEVAAETLRQINPKAELTPFNKGKCMAYGDDCCEVHIQVND
ncbi:MAG: hypothetical protein ABFS43_15515 [Thermodesulfobacteriota bacterium]